MSIIKECLHAYLVQNLHDGRNHQTLHFDASLSDLYFVASSQGCKKSKSAATVIHQGYFLLIWMEFGMLVRFVDLMRISYSFDPVQSPFMGENLDVFVGKRLP